MHLEIFCKNDVRYKVLCLIVSMIKEIFSVSRRLMWIDNGKSSRNISTVSQTPSSSSTFTIIDILEIRISVIKSQFIAEFMVYCS